MARILRVFPLMQFVFFAEILFPIFVVQSSFLLNAWESKNRSDRSVVTPQVNHVVCFSVGAISSASFLN